ncbi:hypothetical protein APHAL10511_003782 [Amanita phalloides]|nr:hypothetical protein APHAL10511_003782 [Amanita phalloides]
MAPFFKSSSLFTISHRRRKVKTLSDNLDSSPPTLHSRSLPNIEELHESVSPKLDEGSIALSMPLGDSEPVPLQANEEPIVSPRPLFDDAQSILSIESNSDEDAVSVSISEQSDSPKLDETSFSLATPSISELVSSSECDSPKLEEESTPRIPPSPSLSLENDSDGDSTPRATSCTSPVPSSAPIPSLERDLAGGPIPLAITLSNVAPEPFTPQRELYVYGGDLPKSAAVHDVTFEEHKTLVAANDDESSITALPSIERLTPRKSTPPLSKTKTMSITSSRKAEHAAFLKQLDDFAVFFGVEKPSKIAHAPPLTYVRRLRLHHSGANYDKETIKNYETSIASYQRMVSLLEEDVSDYKKSIRDLQNAEDRLNHELDDTKADYHIQKLENIKLNKAISEIKYDFIRILQRQDWEMAQMKRFIAAMIDVELHIPVLYNANDLLEKGVTADVALITAIKDAADNIGSPWATIIPAVVGERPDELYLSAIKRSAKLSDELHEATKKYQYWKMKAQMEPGRAKHITPSSSTLSLFLGAWLSKHSPAKDLGCVDDLLNQLQSGEARTRDSRPSINSNTVVVGPSKVEEPEPESGRVDDLLNQLRSGNISTRVSQRTILIPEPPRVEEVDLKYINHRLNQILSGEVPIRRSRSSTITSPVTPGPSKFEESCISSPCTSGTTNDEVPPVGSDQTPSSFEMPEMLSPEIPDMLLSSPETLKMPPSPVETMIPSPAPSECTFSTGEESVSTIRPYIPGRALFGVDGLAVVPSGFFYKRVREERPDSPASPLTEESTMVENASYIPGSKESLGLEYIEEGPIENIKHENVPNSRVLFVAGSAPPTIIEKATYVSASHESIGLEYIGADGIPLDGRCNPILRDDDESTVEAPIPEPVTQDPEVSGSLKDAVKDTSPSEIVQSTSKLSLNSLKRLSASSSRLKQSISSGLKRLISFGFNNPQQADSAAPENSRPKALHTHHRKLSTLKENRSSTPKHMRGGVLTPVKQHSSIPRGARRPTVSSALKAIDASQSAVPPLIKTHRKQNTVTFESPRLIPSPIKAHKKQNTVTLESCIVSTPPAGKRVPLSNIPLLGGNSQKAHRKVIDQGRRAVRTLAKFIS